MFPMCDSGVSKFVQLPCPEGSTGEESCGDFAICKKICDVAPRGGLALSFSPENSDEVAEDIAACVAAGDQAYAARKNADAVKDYTKALKSVHSEAFEAEILTKRSAAFGCLSTELRYRPASESETQALYGMDPCYLAKLSQRDAKRVVDLFPRHCEGHLRLAFAHYLLENYREAEESCMDGLRWDPQSQALHDCLGLVRKQLADEKSTETERPSRSVKNLREIDDFECVLCLKLFYEPFTTPCGHSFCRQCLIRSLDHNNKCPFCRTVLHLTQELPVSVALKNIVSRAFPKEYEEREAEMSGNQVGSSGELTMPLFVLGTLMPYEKMALNVFEPRYRLMIRRVMEGSRRFVMAQPAEGSDLGVEPVAVECEITECEPLPDGRFYLEIVGKNRIKLLQLWEQDGYRVGKVTHMKDEPNEAERDAALELSKEVKTMAEHNLNVLRRSANLYNAYDRIYGLMERMGTQPGSEDAEAISFWAAAMLPTGCPQRAQLLQMSSTKSRLEWLKNHLGQMSGG